MDEAYRQRYESRIALRPWKDHCDDTYEDARGDMVWEISGLVSAGATSIDALLDEAAETVCRAMADTCVIGILFDDASKIHPLGIHHRDAEMRRDLNAASKLAWEPVGGVSEQVLASGEPKVFESIDLGEQARDHTWAAAFFGEDGIYTALVVPMRAVGTQVGVMALARTPPRPVFSEEDFPFAQAVADRLGLAVRTMHLEDEVAALGVAADATPDKRISTLTDREREILWAVEEGLTSREIGDRLFLSVRTVEWHRARLMMKLGASKRSNLIAIARDLRS
jgi:DNA-binding CsgD family transcriptional regulator